MLQQRTQSRMTTARQKLNRSVSNKELSPQVKIYNRHFYLRQAEHDQIQQEYNHQIKKLANMPKITPNSYILLSEKLDSGISDAVRKHVSCLEDSCAISFGEMQMIIREFISFPKHAENQEETLLCQLWVMICEYQIEKEAPLNVFTALLRILLDPYRLSVAEMKQLIQEIPALDNLDQKRAIFLERNPEVKDQTKSVNKTLALWNKWRSNSTAIKGFDKSHVRPVLEQRKHLTYKPTINQKSQKLAEKSISRYIYENKARFNLEVQPEAKSNLKKSSSPDQLSRYLRSTEQSSKIENTPMKHKPLCYHDILHKRHLQKEDLMKDPFSYERSEDITPTTSRVGKPEEIKSIVNNLYYLKERRQDVDYQSVKQEEQLKKCTFKPEINRSSSARSISPGVKGFNRTIDRLQKGRQEELRKKQAYENLGRVKKPNNCRSDQAPSFIERDAPKLILQVKIDRERIEKIHLRGDQDPHIVAKKFVLKYSLSESMQSVLEELVDEQLSYL